jgi:hypothetical protein
VKQPWSLKLYLYEYKSMCKMCYVTVVHCVRKVAVHLENVLGMMSTSIYTGLNPFNFIREHFLQICVRKVAVYLLKLLEVMSASVDTGLILFNFIRKQFLQVCLWDVSYVCSCAVLNSLSMRGRSRYTADFADPRRQNSGGVRSEERGGHRWHVLRKSHSEVSYSC